MNTTKTLVQQLKEVPAGFLQQDIFNQVARLGVLTYIELLAFRLNAAGNVEVLLTKRDSNDEFWPNTYHNPGTVLRPNDSEMSFASAFDRLMVDEYEGNIISGGPYFAGFWFEQLERGKGVGIVCWIELNDCKVGQFYPINKLPKPIIKGQSRYIQNAGKQYSRYKRGKFIPTPLEQLILQ